MEENESNVMQETEVLSDREREFWAGDDEWTDTVESRQSESAEAEPQAENQPPTADQPQQEEAETQQAEQNPTEESFELVYNGEKVNRTRTEMITLAQKGMNLEKAVERAIEQGRAEGAEASRNTIETLERLATSVGQNTEGFLQWMEDSLRQQAVNELVDGGMQQKDAEELVRFRMAERVQKAEKEKSDRQKSDEAQRMKPWQDFVAQYPEKAAEYQANGAPEAFTAAVNRGVPPIAAQAMVENAEMREQMKAMKNDLEAMRAEKNNKAAAPSAVGGYGAKKEMDAFMRGFLSDD